MLGNRILDRTEETRRLARAVRGRHEVDFLGIRYVLKAIAKSRKLSEHAATLITAWRFR